MTAPASLPTPALVLAADHRARGVLTLERWDDYAGALAKALPHCDGILASAEPLHGLAAAGHVTPLHRTYLSLNRTGLAGSVFELDDRLVTSVARAASDGWTGIKHMTRIDLADPITASALELLGQVLDAARGAGLEALVEPLVWRDGRVSRSPDDIVYAAVVAHDMGAPVVKVPVPSVQPGAARVRAVARIVASVGVPVLFLGGPMGEGGRQPVLEEVRDVMAGGGAGMAMGRTIYQDPDPAEMAGSVAGLVHARVILTVDFGTSVTKVALWGDGGLAALARSELVTTYPNVGWTEQDPLRWWTTVVIACAEARAMAPAAFGEVDVVVCSGARQTFVPVTAEGNPVGKGILWSDRRGAAQSPRLGRADGRRRHQSCPHWHPPRCCVGRRQTGLAGGDRARASGVGPHAAVADATSSFTA